MVCISARPDRYGANGVPWIVAVALYTGLCHKCTPVCERYKDTIVHKFLKKYSKDAACNSDLMFIDNGAWPVRKMLKDISFPDFFHGSSYYHSLRDMYSCKFGNKFIKDATIIHVRLDDAGPAHNFQKFGVYQAFVGTENLIKLIHWAQEKFGLPVYLAGAQNDQDLEFCREILQRCEIPNPNDFILTGNTIDQDIYIMSKAKNLIVGRSTFALMAGLLNENTVYCEDWVHLRDLIGNNKSKKFQIIM